MKSTKRKQIEVSQAIQQERKVKLTIKMWLQEEQSKIQKSHQLNRDSSISILTTSSSSKRSFFGGEGGIGALGGPLPFFLFRGLAYFMQPISNATAKSNHHNKQIRKFKKQINLHFQRSDWTAFLLQSSYHLCHSTLKHKNRKFKAPQYNFLYMHVKRVRVEFNYTRRDWWRRSCRNWEWNETSIERNGEGFGLRKWKARREI